MRRYSCPVLLILFLFRYVRCQEQSQDVARQIPFPQQQIDDFSRCTDNLKTQIDISQSILNTFCKVESIQDLIVFKSQEFQTCCQVEKSILSNPCFDPCVQIQQASDSAVILVDLWRVVCRQDYQRCSQSIETQQPQEQIKNNPVALKEQKQSQQTEGIVPVTSILEEFPKFSYLFQYLSQAGILQLIQTDLAPFTLFAPSNQAFLDFADKYGVTADMLDQIPNWTEILLYHFVIGIHRLDTIRSDTALNTQIDKAIIVHGSEESQGVSIIQSCCVSDSTAKVLAPDTLVFGGILHAIDTILVPDTVIQP
eukprot:TRINITY_DN3905_c0_g1_i2.p1 TRINITY_DN3905_c0_g1~~TRINITY_DN3905_c0_g1_i2.p1  ORF type:complete len:336 (+),score=2.52 TRINITY_DN3905_c0_g1_i2:79-1008(+)